MPRVKAQRGRPKGSGLDDSARLEAIAALIAANPDLKPTTAIRSLGITNPSTIRRLRDKFHAARDALMRDLQQSPARPAGGSVAHASVGGGPAPSPVPAIQPGPPVMSAGARSAKRTSRACERRAAPVRPAPALLAANIHEPVYKGLKSADVFACWWGVGLSMASATLDAQFTLFTQLMRMPQMSLAVEQQIALSEFAIATCAPRTRRRTLLH